MDEIVKKRCIICEDEFPATREFFYGTPHTKAGDGLMIRCKVCRNTRRKKRHQSPEGYKWCPICEKEFLATIAYFHVNNALKDHLHYCCKTCANAANTEKYQKTKKKDRSIGRPEKFICKKCDQEKLFTSEYFPKNPACRFGLLMTCRICIEKSKREWRRRTGRVHQRQVLSRKEYNKQRYQQKREAILTHQHWFKANYPEIVRVWQHRYSHSEKGRLHHRVNTQRRRARMRQVPGNHTEYDILQQFKRQKGKCYYCHDRIKGKYEVDHVIPISRPGSSNDPWNLVVACKPCNAKKYNKLPHEWPEGNCLL